MISLQDTRTQYLIGIIGSIFLILLPLQTIIPVELGLLEAAGVVTYAWSVWLLAKNQPLGWWVGLVGVALYIIIFYQVQLYAEVGIQIFYFITSIQAIYIWLRGGTNQTEKLVGHIPRSWWIATLVIAILGVFALRAGLIAIRGAAPFWDALTTVLSLIAHLYLMGRYLESWYIWIAVDIVYVPLYASRGLYVTSILYAVFLLMAINGLRNFRRIYREQHAITREKFPAV